MLTNPVVVRRNAIFALFVMHAHDALPWDQCPSAQLCYHWVVQWRTCLPVCIAETWLAC